MLAPIQFLIVTAIKDGATRNRLRDRLTAMENLPAGCAVRAIPVGPTLSARLHARLEEHFHQPGQPAAILVSDQLDQDLHDPSPLARELYADFGERLYATVAIMDRSVRLVDIDRVVARQGDGAELQAALRYCFERLAYLARPPHRELSHPVVIRPIANQTELLQYFQLRHRVYTPMSYLETLVEEDESKMDIDWFDTRSVHLGAFEHASGCKTLIGTARLITTEPVRPDHAEWTRELAQTDPVLDRLVHEGAVQALLPVFQSHDLKEHLEGAVAGEFLVGELSRVIVHPDYRGAQLGHRLVAATLDLAVRIKLREIFLECLPIHEGIYARAGFQSMPGKRGKVYSVNKTMRVMRRALGPAPAPV